MKTKTLTTVSATIALAFLLAPLAYAQTGSTGAGAPVPTPPIKVGQNIACVQAAVDTREDAIGGAFTAFSTAESAALSARKTALHDAWGNTDATARRTARNKAWSDFKTTSKSAFTTLRTSKKDAWSKFETASKACKIPVVETSATEGVGSLGL